MSGRGESRSETPRSNETHPSQENPTQNKSETEKTENVSFELCFSLDCVTHKSDRKKIHYSIDLN